MARRTGTIGLVLGVALTLPAAAWADGAPAGPPAPVVVGDVGLVRSASVVTPRRTLYDLPLKRLVTDAETWKRTTEGLIDAPPAPDFAAGEACVLVVANASGNTESWVERVEPGPGGSLRIVLVRREDEAAEVGPGLACFFFVLRARPSGVQLDHRTLLVGGAGFIERSFPPADTDAEPRLVPPLGPDLRLSVAMADRSPLPEGLLRALQLRFEAHFPGHDTAGRAAEGPFPSEGLPFPRLRKAERCVYAAYLPEGPGRAPLRSVNPLSIDALPPASADGGPRPVVHRFLLEPVPQ